MYCRFETDVLPKQVLNHCRVRFLQDVNIAVQNLTQAVTFLRAKSESGDHLRRQYLALVCVL